MSSMLYNMENLAACKLTAGITTSSTTVTVDDTTGFPQGTFRATLMPSSEMSRKSNSEIVLCDVISGTSIGITRAQSGTTARAFSAGDILVNGVYTEDIEQAQSVGTTTFATTFSNNVYTISSNNDMLPALPTDGMKITISAGGTSTGAATLVLQSGSTGYPLMTGSAINTGSIAHNAASLENGEQYELVFDGNYNYWMVTNLVSGGISYQNVGTGSGGLISGSDIDWSTMKIPSPDLANMTTIDIVTSAGAIHTATVDCYVGGKCYCSSGGGAFVSLDNNSSHPIMGITYNQSNSNIQVAIMVMVKKGETLYFHKTGTGQFQNGWWAPVKW